MKYCKICIMIVIGSGFINIVAGAVGEWSQTGTPYITMGVTDIAIGYYQSNNQPVIYATDTINWVVTYVFDNLEDTLQWLNTRNENSKFLKSLDHGTTWIELTIPSGIRAPRVTICKPNDPSVVYIGSHLSGIFINRSEGGPDAWIPKNNGITNKRVNCMQISNSNQNIVYLGCNYANSGESGSFFITTDEGESWLNRTPSPQTGFACYDIAVDPIDPNRIFVCGQTAPGYPFIFRTTNGGVDWENACWGISDWKLYSIIIDPDNPSVLYGGSSIKIWKTTDNGSNWLQVLDVNNELHNKCLSLTVHKVGTVKYIVAAVKNNKIFISSNEGSTWTQYGQGNYDDNSLSILSEKPSISYPNGFLYLGTMASFYRSVDIGENWQECTDNFHIAPVNAITVNYPNIFTKSYGGVEEGGPIHRSVDYGQNRNAPRLTWT